MQLLKMKLQVVICCNDAR